MSKLIFALASLVLAAIIVFYFGSAVLNGTTDPLTNKLLLGGTGQGLKTLIAEKSRLNSALNNAALLNNKIEELRTAEQSISEEDRRKLNEFIPDNINNVDFIVDINGIASRHGMLLKNVKVQNAPRELAAKPVSAEKAAEASVTGASKIMDTTLSFSVSGTYNSLLGFLDDLAKSLRVADVTSLTFSVDEKGLNQYNVELKTYYTK